MTAQKNEQKHTWSGMLNYALLRIKKILTSRNCIRKVWWFWNKPACLKIFNAVIKKNLIWIFFFNLFLTSKNLAEVSVWLLLNCEFHLGGSTGLKSKEAFMKITLHTYTTYTWPFFCQKQLHILHIQLKILWSLFSKEWYIHTFSWLFGKSNLSVYLAVTEIGNTSGNISWTVVLERNIYGSTAMPGGWCPVVQVLHMLLCKGWPHRRDKPHRNK